MDDASAGADLWRPLSEEIEHWKSGGRIARLWLRDDDAVEPTPALKRLSDLTLRFRVPAVLAVIPARTGTDLARWLSAKPHVHPAVHGWSHQNHAPVQEKRQELGPHRARQIVLDELDTALRRMRELYADRLFPMLVPPWNRIDATLIGELPRLGFAALSAFGREPAVAPVPVINTHVDIIDSRAGSRCREPSLLIGQLAQELARARAGGGHAVGILSHHLADDERALQFLERLFRITADHSACRWLGPGDLVGN